MGYTTEYEGQIEITPPLTATMVDRFNSYAEQRHDGDGPTRHAINCDWRVTDDGRFIEWNGAEKFYDGPAWMAWMIDRYVPANRQANGQMVARGEEPGDHWLLKVTDRKVTTHQAVITFAAEGAEVDPATLGPQHNVIY